MVKSRTKKATLNIITATIAEIVALICGLILPRLILRNFGSAYNGITSSATQFLSLISILNLGVGGSTRVALYKTLASGDIRGSSALVKATEKYMRKVGLILLVYILGLATVYPLVKNTGYGYFDVGLLILATGISEFANYFFGTTYQTFLNADQSIYVSNICTVITTILNTIISAILIYAGATIQIVKLGSALVYCFKPIAQNVYVKKKYKLMTDIEPDNTALNKRRDVMAHSIANIVHENTDIIVLNMFCDIKIVSVYTVYNLVMSALRKMLKIFTTGIESIFGSMWAKGEMTKIEKNLGLYEFIISSLVSVTISITIVMLLPFIGLYTKDVNDVEYILPVYALVTCIATAAQCFRAPYLTLVQGAGHYKETRNGAFAEAGINLVLSVVMVQFCGVLGVTIGTLAANLFRTFQYAIYADNHLVKRGKSVFVKRMIWTACNITLICCISSFIGLEANTWLTWVMKAAVVGLLSLVITIASSAVFYKKDAAVLLELLKNVFNRTGVRKHDE